LPYIKEWDMKKLVFLVLVSFLYSKMINEKQILTKAKNEKKLILVEATSKYCYYCIKMDKEVFSENKIKKILKNHYIFVKIDIENSKLPFNLNKHFKNFTPSFFILNHNGKLVKKYPGSWNKDDFKLILEENL